MRRVGSSTRASAIYVFPMPDPYYQHGENIVLNLADDAVLPYTVAPEPNAVACKRLAEVAWIMLARNPLLKKAHDAFLRGTVELFKVFQSARFEPDRPNQVASRPRPVEWWAGCLLVGQLQSDSLPARQEILLWPFSRSRPWGGECASPAAPGVLRVSARVGRSASAHLQNFILAWRDGPHGCAYRFLLTQWPIQSSAF